MQAIYSPNERWHQNIGNEILYIHSAGNPGHCTPDDVGNDEGKIARDVFLPLQLPCAAQQVKNLPAIINLRAALRRTRER